MKDVRTEDGWQIRIWLGDAVYITHVRWEQSFAGPPDQYLVQWELQLSFDKQMKDLRAVWIRIKDIKFCDNITPALKDKVSNIAQGAGYIVG
jgi:hypothetical protein